MNGRERTPKVRKTQTKIIFFFMILPGQAGGTKRQIISAKRAINLCENVRSFRFQLAAVTDHSENILICFSVSGLGSFQKNEPNTDGISLTMTRKLKLRWRSSASRPASEPFGLPRYVSLPVHVRQNVRPCGWRGSRQWRSNRSRNSGTRQSRPTAFEPGIFVQLDSIHE